MKSFFLYMRMYPFWVLAFTLIIWIGGWRATRLPPLALLIIVGMMISLGRFAKKEMLGFSSKDNHVTSKKQLLRILPVILTGFVIAGLAKMMIGLIIWMLIWVCYNTETADLLVTDNLLFFKYLDFLVCIPCLVLFFILYRVFKPQEYK